MALRELFAMAAAVALGAPVEPVQTGPGTRYFDGEPPARFIKEGIVPVLFVDPSRLNQMCGVVPPPGLTLMACTRLTKTNIKVVIMPHPAVAMKVDPYALILAHELGHQAGWPGTHPL